MKKPIFLLILCSLMIQLAMAQAIGIGNYPPVVAVISGANLDIMPSSAPDNASNATATAPAGFGGVLLVNPLTGVVSVSNAHPSGSWFISVKLFNGTSSATTGFILNVNNGLCSQGLFTVMPEQPTASLPYATAAGDLNHDGYQDVVTANYGNNNVSVLWGNGLGGFSGIQNVPAGTGPQGIALGDFNADGNEDIAVANFISFNVSILLSNGAGGFIAAPNVVTGSFPYSIATGDLNGDGLLDIITANYGSNNVSVRLGNGSGGFTGSANIPVGVGPRSVVTGDFNNDGKTDFATANYDNNSASVRLGNGSGGFSGVIEIPVGNNPYSVAAGDLNADGKTDLATANRSSNDISVRFGDGSGNFTGSLTVATGLNPRSLLITDLNGDGRADLATANIAGNNVSVILNKGAGVFNEITFTGTGVNPYAIAAGDFNQDGITDLVTANAGSNGISILPGRLNEITVKGNNLLINDGDLIPSADDHTDFENVNGNTSRIFSIENTGAVDLRIGNISISGADSAMFTLGPVNFPLNLPPGNSFSFSISFSPSGPGLKSASVRILNDDCDESEYDFAIQGTGLALVPPVLGTYPPVTVITGGNTTVLPSAVPQNTPGITAYASAGFKGVLLADPVTGEVRIVNAYPAGTYNITVKSVGVFTATAVFQLTVTHPSCSQGLFRSAVTSNSDSGTYALTVADLDADGNQDIITANKISNTVVVHKGNGSGGFVQALSIPAGIEPVAVAAGDLNSDGIPDLIIANRGGNTVSILTGNSSGGYTNTANLPAGIDPRAVLVGDLNNDGKPDLATADYGSNSIILRFGDGFGSFYGMNMMPTGQNPAALAMADLNADGFMDILSASYGNNTIAVHLGNGMGGFSPVADVPVGINPIAVVAADLNSDGKPDLVAADYGSNSLSVRWGDGVGGFSGTTDLVVGIHPVSVVIGDVNGDGIPDLASANASGNSVSIRLGNGSGGFITRPDEPTGSGPRNLVIGDFNNDGLQDLATANVVANTFSILEGGSNEVSIQGNNTEIPDGDDTPDINDHTDFGNVTSNLIRSFSIKNQGNTRLKITAVSISGADSSSFSVGGINLPIQVKADSMVSFTISFTPANVGLKTATVQIMNDDCNEAVYDFAVMGTGVSIFTPTLGVYPPTAILYAGGNATVQPSAIPANAPYVTAYTNASFKGLFSVDPATGMVTITNAHPAGNYLVTVKVNGISTAVSSFMLTVGNTACSKGQFYAVPELAAGNLPFSTAIGDFNGDGNQDLVLANYGSNTASVRLGNGNGGFISATEVPVGINPYSVAVGDYNGDGKADFAVANNGSSNVSVRLGDGMGGFTSNAEIPVGLFPTSVINADVNADGKLDLCVLSTGNNAVAIRLGDGSGNFNGSLNVTVGSGAFSLASGDFNNDGKPDLASVNYNVDHVTINLGDGLGGFNFLTEIPVGVNPYSIVIGEFNGDGNADIATANYNGNSISIRLGDGTGHFMGNTEVTTGAGPGSIAAGDFNGDGRQDLVTANYTGNSVSVRYGDGQGNFSGNGNLPMGSSPYVSIIGDFNNDGKQDIGISKQNSTVTILLGTDNEINLEGNGISISDGDSTPDTADLTDFGTTSMASSTFSIENTGTGNLFISNIGITGTDASLFSISGITLPLMVPGGGTVNFVVSFSPVRAGLRSALITVYNDDCDEGFYDFGVQGSFLCPAVPVSFSGLPAGICLDAPSVTLTGTPSAGGVFSGNGIIGSTGGTASFVPSLAGPGGPYPILFTYTDSSNDCIYMASQPVVVYDLPVVSISGLEPAYCVSAGYSQLTGIPSGGIFSGPGMFGNLFDPSASGPGQHNITYTFTNVNGCTNSTSQVVMVNELPVVDFSGFAQAYCADAAPVSFTGSPFGGTFSGPGMNGQLFDPAAAGEGQHVITYMYTDPNGCSNSMSHAITVNALPVVGFSGLDAAYCINAGSSVLTGLPAGGMFIGTGITGNGFDPAIAGAGGPYTVAYSYTDGNGCSSTAVQSVTVNPLPVVVFTGLAPAYCTTDAAVTITANHTGSIFSMNGPGLTDNGNGTATFDPSVMQAGTYFVTSLFTNGNGCSENYTQQVSVSVCPLFSTLHLKFYLEGFYRGGGMMATPLYDLGLSPDPTITDEVSISLWSAGNLANAQPDHTVTGLLHADGFATMQFPASAIGNSYYIVIRHRNSLETWSSTPLTFAATNVYDFSDGLSKAYDDGINPPMADMGPGIFAIYGGDVNQDGSVDGLDASEIEINANLFSFGYDVTDANGDLATDGLDASVVEINANKFIFYSRPF